MRPELAKKVAFVAVHCGIWQRLLQGGGILQLFPAFYELRQWFNLLCNSSLDLAPD